ncbi:MAG TPA: YciI family protein [Acetobacteraceae bacterium]|nr:YciI family protein [Acetobacteraceae bacterium]
MMAWVVLAHDGEDEGAPARRAAAMEAHVACITAEAAAGRLALGLPLIGPDRILGSLMVVAGEERSAADAYLAKEPFALGGVAGGVWRRVEVHPFRVAPLPYRPWPSPDTPPPTSRTHTVILAWDGRDADAPARRQAARDAHFARVRPFAADGTLAFGGALLDREGGMVGSVAVTRHDTDEAARAWMADDPYVTGGVWRDVTLFGTRIRPLAYAPLPGMAGNG